MRCSFWCFTVMLCPYVGYVEASAYVGLLATRACVDLCTTFRFSLGVLRSGCSCCSTVIVLWSTVLSVLACSLLRFISVILLLLFRLLWLIHFFMALSVPSCWRGRRDWLIIVFYIFSSSFIAAVSMWDSFWQVRLIFGNSLINIFIAKWSHTINLTIIFLN